MKWLIIFLMFFPIVSAYGQEFNLDDLVVNNQDTILYIPNHNKGSHSCMHLENGFVYHLYFYEDFHTYELCIVSPPKPYESVLIFSVISWGNYKVRGNKMLFQDRIGGFKMVASIESDGIRFHNDYFPYMNKDIWIISKSDEEDTHGFVAMFDNKKAERYRNDYDKKYKEPFELTFGVYNYSLEISKDGKWVQKYDDFVLAEGRWHRKRNILVLNCPKLKCNFYMTIDEKRLGSMLLLMDLRGKYYYPQAYYDELFPR